MSGHKYSDTDLCKENLLFLISKTMLKLNAFLTAFWSSLASFQLSFNYASNNFFKPKLLQMTISFSVPILRRLWLGLKFKWHKNLLSVQIIWCQKKKIQKCLLNMSPNNGKSESIFGVVSVSVKELLLEYQTYVVFYLTITKSCHFRVILASFYVILVSF